MGRLIIAPKIASYANVRLNVVDHVGCLLTGNGNEKESWSGWMQSRKADWRPHVCHDSFWGWLSFLKLFCLVSLPFFIIIGPLM